MLHSHLNSVQQIKSYQPDLLEEHGGTGMSKNLFLNSRVDNYKAIKQLVHQIQAEMLKSDI